MKSIHMIIISVPCAVIIAYASIIGAALGTEEIFNPASIMYFPGVVIQLVENKGNGIVCVDACGPCSSYGSLYVMKDGKCVLSENTTRNLPKTVTIDKNSSVPITEPFEYDDLCLTQFWTEITNKPEQRYVSSLLQEQLKERLDWHISNDKITFWDKNEEFVVTIPGDWQARDAPIIVVKETLERIEGITRVKDIRIACA